MRKILPLLLLAPLAGCETPGRTPYDPVGMVEYSAIGLDPFWMIAIGDDSIVLTLGDDRGELQSHRFARTLPRMVDGVRRWESGEGTEVVGIEAAPGPCEGSGGRRYRDRVTVRLSGRELVGCGGRLLTSAGG